MVDFKYDFAFLIKMIKYVFLPVLAVVILTAFIIFIYSRSVKKKDIKRYNYLVEFWTTFLAILIIGSLFAVTVGFSVSLSNAIRMYNLVEGHEVIYYLVLGCPLIPLLFLVIYIYRMVIVLLSKPKKEKELVKEEDIVPEPSNVVVQEENIEKGIEEVSTEAMEEDEDNEELADPIVVTESDNIEETSTSSNIEMIEDRDFTPIVAPERKDDTINQIVEDNNSLIEETEVENTNSEDIEEEIELL